MPTDFDTVPYPVVYSTESGDYRRATVAEIDAQLHAQARVTHDMNAYKRDDRPDKLDREWANWQEFVSMISRSPHGLQRGRIGQRGSLRTRHAAVDTLLSVVPAGYGKRDGVIEW